MKIKLSVEFDLPDPADWEDADTDELQDLLFHDFTKTPELFHLHMAGMMACGKKTPNQSEIIEEHRKWAKACREAKWIYHNKPPEPIVGDGSQIDLGSKQMMLFLSQLEAWQKIPPEDAGITPFAECVSAAIYKLGLAGKDKRRKGKVGERTIRHYQTEKWISAPNRIAGKREVRYKGIHFAQMLTAYKLRKRGEDATRVSKMGIQQCVGAFAASER